jgi:uncharacterized membrane protein
MVHQSLLRAMLVVLFLSIALPASAKNKGLVGGLVRGIGKATGIKEITKAGEELDNAHRDIKNEIPPYKAIEEETSAFVRKRFLDACNATYQTLTSAVIARCSNWDARLDDQPLVQRAVDSLVNSGLFQRSEFNGVQIRWCPLSGAQGMAPDRGRIYLDTAAKSEQPDNLAALLAHEMTHVRQYRRMGTDQFKCEYSRKYIECGGCQDERHPLEREAYEFETVALNKLENVGWKMCNLGSENTIWVAYAYVESPSGWKVEGWRELGRGECSMLVSNIATRYLYFFALGSGGETWKGDHRLCLHPENRFTLIAGTSCDQPYEAREFMQVDTGGSKSWVTNLGK